MQGETRDVVADRFEVEREVGRGAIGVVYRARDRETGMTVALKIIQAKGVDEDDRARLRREGEILASLDHPGIVRLIAHGSTEAPVELDGALVEAGSPYIAMEWLDGEDLDARQKRAPLTLRQAVEVARQIALALAAAHAANVVHRDIKPSNIFVQELGRTSVPANAPSEPGSSPGLGGAPGSFDHTPIPATSRAGTVPAVAPAPAPDEPRPPTTPRSPRFTPASGTMAAPSSRANPPSSPPKSGPRSGHAFVAKIVDFGVAATREGAKTPRSDEALQPGAIVGTPAYMAPEQARGDAVGTRADLYSLGATLFELVTGRPPHVGPTNIATLARLVTTPAPRLSDLVLSVPSALDLLVERLLESEPERRPASAREVADALLALLETGLIEIGARPVAKEIDSSGMIGTRVVTTIVALRVGEGDARLAELDRLRDAEAEALPLGSDALVAHFGTRRARGGEAARALELALDLAARGAHVGAATGRMRLDQAKSAGAVVDRASSLARDAGAGRLLADTTTTELARGRFELEPRGVGAAFVTAATAPKPTALSAAPFVGREAELAAASNAFERCVDDAAPILVSVSGPPGIGKSRLGREFLAAAIERVPHAAATLVRCEPYARAEALGVAVSALRALVGLPKGATLEQAVEVLDKRRVKREGAPLLACLLANAPVPEEVDLRAAQGALTIAMTELALSATTGGACALLVEDAQWSDPESIAWIDHLLGRATGRPLLVMLLVRPAFWREQGSRFSGRDHVRIELRPLARRAAREIARSVIGARADDAMLDRVAAQAGGSPLFAEELARVVASGKDTKAAPTIEAAIQVSLDALDDLGRDAAVRASVFGMSFWDLGLAELGTEDPAAAARRLVGAELVVEAGDARFLGAKEFVFKHALVRDVAYASAGEELKKRLHTAAARWLASVGEDAATVAQHLELGDQGEAAADYWEKAARRALAANALRDAVTMADKALVFAPQGQVAFARAALLDEAYERLDARSSERDSALRSMADNVFDEESELHAISARARFEDACGSGMDLEARLDDVRTRARKLGLEDEEARASATLARRHAFGGELAQAEAESARLLELATRPGLEWAAIDAYQALAVVHQTRGELARALEARKSAARAARDSGLQQREATLTMNVGFALTTIGAKAEALAEIESGIAKALAIGSEGAVRQGQMLLLCWSATFGADPRLDAQLAEARASADEAGGAMWVVRDRVTLGTLFYRGSELLREGQTQLVRARSLLKLAAEGYRATDNRDVLPVALGLWAEAERRSGHAEQAVDVASDAARLLEGGAPSLLNEAPIYLALHDAYVDIGDLRGARDAMVRGVEPLLRRLKGLEGTPYARHFLTGLSHNAGLIAAAEAYGVVPPEVEGLLDP